MCNLYTQTRSVEALRQILQSLQMPVRFPEGIPNLAPRDICITDPAPIIRRSTEEQDSYDSSSAAGVGRGRAASRSTISARRGASSGPAAA